MDAAAKALSSFELDTRFRSFKTFHPEQAVAFKRHLAEQTNARTGKPLAKATIHSTLAALKAFFVWLAGQPSYRSRLSYSDADYFNLSDRDARIARTRRDKPAPSLEQVRHVIGTMPTNDAIQRRDRALVAFILLTGARDGAVASLKLKHLNLALGCVVQDAREVATKFGKTFTTSFFPVGADVQRIVEEWAEYLTVELLWGPDDPLFPATLVEGGMDRTFRAVGLERRHWSSADPIRQIFRRAFTTAGLSYFPPHRLRDTIVLLGQRLCQSPEQFKAWSQNLGHSDVLTTFTSYGDLTQGRQAEIIRGLGRPRKSREEVLNLLAGAMEDLRRVD
ncbi:MAG: site-specific recombinase XerC [Enhydrobacter sp.]|nr:MAG: site-specific recombinase XerC [Enhydrobacter sp.]